jgi:hypothetical protein
MEHYNLTIRFDSRGPVYRVDCRHCSGTWTLRDRGLAKQVAEGHREFEHPETIPSPAPGTVWASPN